MFAAYLHLTPPNRMRRIDPGKKSRVVMSHFGLIATSRSLKKRRPNKVTDAVALLRDMVDDTRYVIFPPSSREWHSLRFLRDAAPDLLACLEALQRIMRSRVHHGARRTVSARSEHLARAALGRFTR